MNQGQFDNQNQYQNTNQYQNQNQYQNAQMNWGQQIPTRPVSFFDGGLLQLVGWIIIGYIVTIFTLGICFPWAITMIYKWKIEHSVIEGRRLRFHGTALGLFGNWIKWWLLCIITLGIYSFWLYIALEKWKVKHTTFE